MHKSTNCFIYSSISPGGQQNSLSLRMENYMLERKQPHQMNDHAIQVLLVHIFYLSSEGKGGKKKKTDFEGGTDSERIPRSCVPFPSG